MQNNHDVQVAAIAAEVRKFYKAGKPFKIFHGSTNSTRILSFKRSETIDVSQLSRVLSIDLQTQTAWVEANVPMDRLVSATLRYGLVPKVVMEFPGITVGGGIQGAAGESSSFRYGGFHETCNRYEMILADGRVIEASPKKHADLFYGTAGSFGTLGIITAAEVQLIPAKKYVRLTYMPVDSFEQAVETIKTAVKQDYNYIDGIMLGPAEGVVIVGQLSDAKVGKCQRFTRARDEWYYLHAAKISASRQETTESVPIVDYLFRYDRGAFWTGSYVFEVFGVPFNRLTRWVFNPVFHTRRMYQALQASGASQQYIVQDLALPQDTAVAFMKFIDRTHTIYPLWLCPLKPSGKSPLLLNNVKTPLLINVGVWGNRITDHQAFVAANRQLERFVQKFGGRKWFYAHTYYTEKEFWKLYDKAWYDSLRRKYHATSLPTVYDKVHVKDYYPVNFRRGALRTMLGMTKLRIKD